MCLRFITDQRQIQRSEFMQAWLQSERKATDDLRKDFSEAEVRNSELATKLENVTRKVDQLQELVQRLEERLSNSESEIQVLREQAPKTPENGNPLDGETKTTPDMTLALEVEEKPRKYLNEKLREGQDLLVKCISKNLGYTGGKPIAACVIYKCLFHWRSFQAERTSIFDCIIQTIASAIEVSYNNEVLAYWLSNSATLLLLLQRSLKATGSASLRRRTSTFLFERMPQGLRVSPSSAGLSFPNRQGLAKLDELRQVEAKYPAQLFKEQLNAFLKKIYKMMRDNLKKEISPYLELCIQASRKKENDVPQQALISHWQNIVKSLNTYLNVMKTNNAPPFLVRKVFAQVFFFINIKLFNSILLRRECCSLRNGEYVEAGLAEFKQWCVEATDEYAGSAWDELRHIRQAVGFLVIHQKPKMSLDEIMREVCPVLGMQQIYRISTLYWDNKYGTLSSVSKEVLEKMRVMMTEDSNNAVSNSFLLDDDSSIPFTVEDISKSMQEVDLYDIEPPQLLHENPDIFGFLLARQS